MSRKLDREGVFSSFRPPRPSSRCGTCRLLVKRSCSVGSFFPYMYSPLSFFPQGQATCFPAKVGRIPARLTSTTGQRVCPAPSPRRAPVRITLPPFDSDPQPCRTPHSPRSPAGRARILRRFASIWLQKNTRFPRLKRLLRCDPIPYDFAHRSAGSPSEVLHQTI